MALALSKSSLKQQRDQLKLFQKFLPSLDLKRQQLLAAFKAARDSLEGLQSELRQLDKQAESLYPLLGGPTMATVDLSTFVRVNRVKIETENVAGVRLPRVDAVEFSAMPYSTLATPFWIDQFVATLRRMVELRIAESAQTRRVEVLEQAARRVTQRVNLFDKVLIPQAQQNIKQIQIFLADQERSAVVRSKIAKAKTKAESAAV